VNLLAIETSTSRASVALSFEGEVFVSEETGTPKHAGVLLLMIDALLKRAKIDFKVLDGVVFGEGPGSFTGVRLACSVAKGFAYAYNLPLFPVSALYAIAFQMREEKEAVLAMLDARMHQVYFAFQPDKGGKAFVSSPEAIQVQVENPFVLAGVGFKPYVNEMPEKLRALILQQHEIFPEASAMIALVESGVIQSVTATEALPMYVREQVTGGQHG
jgi:tRNA threonylcarbamoyladenosine biosynthesis protein TsaB